MNSLAVIFEKKKNETSRLWQLWSQNENIAGHLAYRDVSCKTYWPVHRFSGKTSWQRIGMSLVKPTEQCTDFLVRPLGSVKRCLL